MSAKFTKSPWHFDRMESAEEFATLKGETLAEHEGYYRDNNGDWIVTFRDEEGDMGGRIAAVTFKGKAKRGEMYRAPDPEGMANAHLIAAAPELFEALDEVDNWLRSGDPSVDGQALMLKVAAALAKARGETA